MNHLTDETLSALVDEDAVDGGDVAHVDECTDCRTRLDGMRRVSAAFREPAAPPAAHQREAAVAAALVETTGTTATLRRLTTARRARTRVAPRPARRTSALSAAAALIVALGVGAWLLSQVGTDSDHASNLNTASALPTPEISTTVAAFDPQRGAAAGGATAASGSLTSGGVDGATLAAQPAMGYQAGDVGEFADIDDLASVARRDLAQSEETKAQHPADGSPCPLPAESEQLWTAKVTFQGRPAAAWVRTTPSGRLLEVLDVDSACAVVASRAI